VSVKLEYLRQFRHLISKQRTLSTTRELESELLALRAVDFRVRN